MLKARIILQTERLTLHQLTLTDTPFIIELLNTEGWLKYIGNRNVKTADQARQYLLNGPLKSYADNGFGLYRVSLKNSGTPIGLCGLVKRAYLPGPDIGYAFLPGAAGKGYAFEITNAVIRFAFTELQIDRLFAITFPDNLRSVKLLLKAGMNFEERFVEENSHEILDRYSLYKKPV
jgi:RimJ/RimL family protein N-acetyltransferase